MVEAEINYLAPMAERPRYHANDQSRDVLELAPTCVGITDLRDAAGQPDLDREGFTLVTHRTGIEDYTDRTSDAIHKPAIRDLLLQLSGADEVVVNAPGVLRFGEKSGRAGSLDNSRPARFVHVDISDATAREFVARITPEGRRVRRSAHYNVWRAFSGAPQDVPLALCDARSVAPEDLVAADAVFDKPGAPEWSFEGWCVAANPAHRWCYFRDMGVHEVLVFKTNDSEVGRAHCVPHSAFNDPNVAEGVRPRASIEMRGIALWYE